MILNIAIYSGGSVVVCVYGAVQCTAHVHAEREVILHVKVGVGGFGMWCGVVPHLKHNSPDCLEGLGAVVSMVVVVVAVVVVIAVGVVVSVNMRVEAVGVSASLTARGECVGDGSEVE